MMDRDQIWQVIDEQRAGIADLLAGLTDGEWQRPSLCADWTVRQVAAHLTQQELGVADLFTLMRAWRGSFDRTTRTMACRQAAVLSSAQIVAGIRGTVGSRRHNPGVTYLETLADILVHGQDIAIPLGRSHDLPVAAAAVGRRRSRSAGGPGAVRRSRSGARGHVVVAADDEEVRAGLAVRSTARVRGEPG